MSEHISQGSEPANRNRDEQRDLLSYVWGISLALVLTLAPFALVHWHGLARSGLLIAIGAFAFGQMVVHFRFFLHLGFNRKREDLQLILFSALLMIMMVAGTLWIMNSLAVRMGVPMHP